MEDRNNTTPCLTYAGSYTEFSGHCQGFLIAVCEGWKEILKFHGGRNSYWNDVSRLHVANEWFDVKAEGEESGVYPDWQIGRESVKLAFGEAFTWWCNVKRDLVDVKRDLADVKMDFSAPKMDFDLYWYR